MTFLSAYSVDHVGISVRVMVAEREEEVGLDLHSAFATITPFAYANFGLKNI